MLPTSQVVREEGSGSAGTQYHMYLNGWRQAPPYDLVLPVERRYAIFDINEGATFGPARYSSGALAVALAGDSQVQNRTYSKFINKLHGAQADVGILFGEYKSSRDMITKRAEQMWRMAVALKRGDIRGFMRTAGLSVPPGKQNFRPRKTATDISSLWLEYSWGWRPMIEDIYNALKVLVESDFSIRYLRASVTGPESKAQYIWNNQQSRWAGCNDYVFWDDSLKYRLTCSTGATVRVSNPNIALANRMGVINPMGVIWAVQPFSFVVDKYINVSQMLNSFSDLYGFHLEGEWTCWTCKGSFSEKFQNSSVCDNGYTYFDFRKGSGRAYAKKRWVGLLGPTLAFKTPTIGNLSEAASYIALVVQLITKR